MSSTGSGPSPRSGPRRQQHPRRLCAALPHTALPHAHRRRIRRRRRGRTLPPRSPGGGGGRKPQTLGSPRDLSSGARRRRVRRRARSAAHPRPASLPQQHRLRQPMPDLIPRPMRAQGVEQGNPRHSRPPPPSCRRTRLSLPAARAPERQRERGRRAPPFWRKPAAGADAARRQDERAAAPRSSCCWPSSRQSERLRPQLRLQATLITPIMPEA